MISEGIQRYTSNSTHTPLHFYYVILYFSLKTRAVTYYVLYGILYLDFIKIQKALCQLGYIDKQVNFPLSLLSKLY